MQQDDEMDARSGGALSRQEKPNDKAMTGIADPVTAGLRQLFARIAEEPIPDEFLRLLDEIEARGAETGSDPQVRP